MGFKGRTGSQKGFLDGGGGVNPRRDFERPAAEHDPLGMCHKSCPSRQGETQEVALEDPLGSAEPESMRTKARNT